MATLACLCTGAVLALALPFGALLWWRRRQKAPLLPALVGALTFAVFALGLEQALHYFCLAQDNPLSRAIRGAPALYVLYAALAAGVFEETGRYLAFRLPLRRFAGRDTAVTYGIGHGGAECVLLLGANYLLYALLAGCSLTGNHTAAMALVGNDAVALAGLLGVIGQVTAGSVALSLAERAGAMVLHAALSVPVFLAARDRTARRYYPLAVLLHAAADVPAALYQTGLLPLLHTELLLWPTALLVLYLARRLYLERLDP